MKKLLSIVFAVLLAGSCATPASAALTSGSPVAGSGSLCRDGNGVISACVSTDSFEFNDLAFTGNLAGGYDNYTANVTLDGQFMVTCDASGGAINITMPTAVGNAGTMYYVKKVDGTNNACNMITNSTETIDGLDDGIILMEPLLSVGFVSDGSNWWTFIRRASAGEVAPTLANYSVIGTFTDWTSVSRLARRDGDYLRIEETSRNPGFQAWWTFEGIHTPNRVIFRGCIYAGTNQHDVEAQIFNNASSAWYELRENAVNQNPSVSDWQHTPYSDESSPHDRIYDVPNPPGDYVDSSGNVLVGIKHTEAGSTSDDWYCDSLHVEGH